MNHKISPLLIKKATLLAKDILEGMGSTGKHGSVHLMELNLQSNAITSIFHNLIAWQISKLSRGWIFHPKGGGTPDLTYKDGTGIQIKTTSDNRIKGNRITQHKGYYICVKYKRERFSITVREILVGDLVDSDWIRNEKTQFAFLTKEGESKLTRIYP